MKVVGVIPAKNEEDTIGDIIDGLEAVAEENGWELGLVVPSNSTDRTDQIVEERGYTIINSGGHGLGEARYRGLKESLDHGPDVVFGIDADMQFRPSELPSLVKEVGEYDLVIGTRFDPDSDRGVNYPMNWSNRIGNWFFTKIINTLTGLELTDAQAGYRAMKPEVAENLEITGRKAYCQEEVIDAHQKGFRIKEVPVSFDKREHGSSRAVSSKLKYGWPTLPLLLHRSNHLSYGLMGLGGLGVLASILLLLYMVTLSQAVNPVEISLILILFFLGVLVHLQGIKIDINTSMD